MGYDHTEENCEYCRDAPADNDNFFECSGCRQEVEGEPAYYISPSYNSPDGLGQEFCAPCWEQMIHAAEEQDKWEQEHGL